MEPNSAACAMEWSIQLEMALRSKTPGRSVEAILQMGPKLEQWSQESEATIAVYNLFVLVPGEDKLFANTILLRLADAFVSNNIRIRLAIVKIFLSERKRRRNIITNRRIKGLVSKSRVHNEAELLMRIKVVYDTGDIQSRSLALALFGCWADFAKDSPLVRYSILSSLVSSHALEVKAALFAAGCFCELADDFASVVLEMLINLATSSETLMEVKLAAVQVFAKMGCTHSVAVRVHKTGLGLVLDCPDEELVITLIVSLSKLASKFSLLIPEQVDLLLSFLSQMKSFHLKATALRCLYFLSIKVGYSSLVSARITKTLCSILVGPGVPSAIHFKTLKILHKVLLYSVDVHEFRQLLTVLEKSSVSQATPESLLAIRILVDVSSKLTKIKRGPNDDYFYSLASRVYTFIMDHIIILIKSSSDDDINCKVVQRMFELLLLLVGEHPGLGVLVLDKVMLFIQIIAELNREKYTRSSSKILFITNTFLFRCLGNFNETGFITTEIYDKVKLLVDFVCQDRLFDLHIKTNYTLMLQSPVIWKSVVNKCTNQDLIFTLDCAHKMVTKRDNWHAYNTGTYASSLGNWLTATSIFGLLLKNVQSDVCCSWLNSLVQLTHSESIIQVFLLPEKESSFLQLDVQNFPSMRNFINTGPVSAGDNRECALSRALDRVHAGLCSAGKVLETNTIVCQKFYFQRWFLALRAKYVGSMLDIVNLLDTGLFSHKSLGHITQISLRLKRLSQEYDMIAKYYLCIDDKSAKLISGLALACSVLALCSGFGCFLPDLTDHKTLRPCTLKSQNNCLGPMLIQNLAGRLLQIDQDSFKNLSLLLERSRKQTHRFNQVVNQILAVGSEARDILSICNYAVPTILSLINEANEVQNEEFISKIMKDGLQFLSSIVMKCIHVPFRTPKCFFKVRPCIGSELFACNAGTSNQDDIFVSSGFHLSLHICLQLKNVPSDLPAQLRKLYCVLWCSVSFKKPKSSGVNNKQSQFHYEAWENDDLVEMDAKLYQYAAEKKCNGKRGRGVELENNAGNVMAFVQLEMDNNRKQGFGTCTLDVSSFPEGNYVIKWQSCCVDSQDCYWGLLPLSSGPIFTAHRYSDSCRGRAFIATGSCREKFPPAKTKGLFIKQGSRDKVLSIHLDLTGN
ncbi:hypothetical protein ACFE04_029970 [Oxalis oulophora]